MGELAWVTEQVESCACVCCHTSDAPEGAAIWGIDSGSIWSDQMSDTAIGMFAGYIDSSALGAYPPEDNNGFDRERTAMPSTDPERMVAFWQAEMDRRGLTADDMSDEPPVGANLLDQVTYELPDCEPGDGIDADGVITWSRDFDVRYLYVLEEGSDNPGLPPNFDMPEGILWRIDVPHDNAPMVSGVTYGSAPAGVNQIVPAEGAPVELVPGQRYNLYALYDVALPIARCVFQVPVEGANTTEEGGCSTAGAAGRGTGAGFLALFCGLVLGGRRRR